MLIFIGLLVNVVVSWITVGALHAFLTYPHDLTIYDKVRLIIVGPLGIFPKINRWAARH